MLPAHLHRQLDPDDLPVAERKVFPEKLLQEYRKTAKAAAQEPWRLFEAQKWLEDLCDDNVAGRQHPPPKLHMIFQQGECTDHCLAPDFEDFYIPDDPEPRHVQVGPPGRKGASKKASARKRPAADGGGPKKRPAAAPSVLRRPGATEHAPCDDAGLVAPSPGPPPAAAAGAASDDADRRPPPPPESGPGVTCLNCQTNWYSFYNNFLFPKALRRVLPENPLNTDASTLTLTH